MEHIFKVTIGDTVKEYPKFLSKGTKRTMTGAERISSL